MTYEEGEIIGEVAMDAVALVEEHSPGCRLAAVQVTLVVVDESGKTKTGTILREIEI